jgi:hypothetical protein
MIGMTTAPAPEAEAAHPHNRIRTGYARASTRGQDYQSQRDAPGGRTLPRGRLRPQAPGATGPQLGSGNLTPGIAHRDRPAARDIRLTGTHLRRPY